MVTATDVEQLKLSIAAIRRVADEVLELIIADPDGEALPAWQPGAHIEIRLPSGLLRQYSLCGDPNDRSTYTIAVLREDGGRGGSREIHEIACAGTSLDVRSPRNNFGLVDADSYVFIGGGIGITPLIPMIGEVRERGKSWSLVYGGRTTTSMAYREVLQSLGSQVELWIESERGQPDLAAILSDMPKGTAVYTCGPGGLIDAVAAEFKKHDQLSELHFERFSGSGPKDSSGDAIEVELRRSGITLTVPDGCPILAEVQKVLPDQPFSCEEGYCGECETRVLGGTPDHRDEYLTEEEQDKNDRMMICVSRCKGQRLVLDL